MSDVCRAAAVRPLARWPGTMSLSAIVVGVLCPAALLAQGPGTSGSDDGAVVILQAHASRAPEALIWTGPVFRLPVPAMSQADLRIDATRFVPNVGRIRGSVEIAADAGGAPARGLIELGATAIHSWVVGVSAGDTSLSAYNLDYRLTSLFTPSVGLRGAQVSATRGASELSVFAGKTTTSAGWFGERVVVSPQTLAGARAILRPTKRLVMASSLVGTSAAPSPGLSIPLSSAAVTSDVMYRLWRELEAVAQATITRARWSDMKPDVARTTSSDEGAVSWVAGTRLASPRRHAELSVVRLGREYLPLPYYAVGDRAGWYASGDQQLGDRLQIYGSANQWHNNVAARPGDQTIFVDQAFVGGRWQLTPSSFVGGRAGAGNVRRVVAGAEEIRSTQQSLYADYTRQIGAWRIVGRGSQVQADENGATRTAVRRDANVEVRRTWRRGAGAWTTLGVLREQLSDQRDPGNRFAGNAGVNLPMSTAIALSAEAELNRQSVVLATSEVRNAAVNTSLSWTLPRQLQLVVHGRYSHDTSAISAYDAAALGPDTLAQFQDYLLQRLQSGYEISIRLQKVFKWRNPALEGNRAAAGPNGAKRVLEFGTVDGVVFNDLNGNGMPDPVEAGVAHVTITLDGERSADVDEAGRFVFRNVPVGVHTVALDERSVPAWWDMGPRRKMMLDVVKRGSAVASFPLVQLGKLRGRVLVIDRPAGATPASLEWSPQREPGPNVIVVLNERYKVTVTDADGEYEFTALPAGEYHVRIEPSSLPQLWTPASPEVQTVVLTPGARIADVDFSFNANARAVRRTLTVSQTLPTPRPEAIQPKRPRRPKVQGPSPPPSAGSSRGASSGAPRR